MVKLRYLVIANFNAENCLQGEYNIMQLEEVLEEIQNNKEKEKK